MRCIVTRQNADGSYDDIGSSQRTIVSGYKTLSGAMRYAIKPFAKGSRVRVEVYHGDNVHRTPDRVMYL